MTLLVPLSFPRYLAALVTIIVMLVGGGALFSMVVNPYGFYPRPDFLPEFFPIKTETARHTRMIKAQQMVLNPPRHIILGSSRAEYGINPKDADLPPGITLYNAALPGTNLYEISRMLDQAIAAGSLRTAVLALDFFMFDDDLPVKPDFDETRFLMNPDGSPNRAVNNDLKTVFSVDTIFDSGRTLLGQNNSPDHTPLGFRYPTDRAAEQRRLGSTGIMARVRADFLKRARADFRMTRSMAIFEAMLASAASHNIRLALVLAPMHRAAIDNLEDAGQGDEFANWRAQMQAAGQRHALMLIDWIDRRGISDEPIPQDPALTMTYFWESVHYTPIVGKKIMQELTARGFFSEPPARADP